MQQIKQKCHTLMASLHFSSVFERTKRVRKSDRLTLCISVAFHCRMLIRGVEENPEIQFIPPKPIHHSGLCLLS